MGTYVATASAPRASAGLLGEGAPWGVLTAAVGVAVWLIVDPRTPDLAAQVYRANLFREAGFLVWDSRWYGGHDMPGYSLVFPPLGALVGVRAVGAAAVLASAALFERIVVRVYGRAARWGAVWFALAALGDAWSGRITFALGVSFALGAVLALMHRRLLAAAILAAVCAACSPVAGVLLALAGLTHTLVVRSPRSLLVLGVPAVVVAGALAGLFGEGGWEPYPLLSFLATVAAILAFLVALPDGQRLLWVGGVVYLVACVACVAVHSPMGANVERYGVLLAGPLLLCALQSSGGRLSAARGSRGWGSRGRLSKGRGSRGRFSAVAVVALVGIGVWTVWGPVRETAAVAGNALDERLLLRTGRALRGGRTRGQRCEGGGAVHARPLGGGVAGAESVAGEGLGEATGRALQRGAARQGSYGGRLSPVVGGGGRALRGAAGRSARSLQRRRGPPDRGGAALPARIGAHAALADL